MPLPNPSPAWRRALRAGAALALATGLLVAVPATAARAQSAPAAPSVSASVYGPMLLETPEGERLLEDGRALLLAFRFDAAEATFGRLAALEPRSPAAAFHLDLLALLRALMTEREPFYGRFYDANDALTDALDALPAGAWRDNLRAEAALHRAVVLAKQERFTQAALALRRAYNGFEGVVRRHPDFEEAYKGMGVCHVVVGAAPRQYRWALRLLGFGGTVQQGLAELERARSRARYGREEATLYLAGIDAALNEGRLGSIRHVEALYRALPAAPAPAYVYGLFLVRERRAAEAEAAFRAAAAAQAPPEVEDVPYVDYYLGLVVFRQNRFDEAARLFERYAAGYRGPALVALAHLYAGLAREANGEREAALVHYARVRSDRDFDGDEAALREARRRIARPMTADERALLVGANLYDAGQEREAIAALQGVFTDAEAEPVLRAEAAYRTGRAYHELEAWEDALRHYGFAAANPGDPLARWGPWSTYYAGEVHEARGEHEEARRAYRAVLDNETPFDYHRTIEQRARTALGRL